MAWGTHDRELPLGMKVHLPLVRQTIGEDERGQELDTGSQPRSASRMMDSSSMSDANFMVTTTSEEH